MWAKLKERLGLAKPQKGAEPSSFTEGIGLPIREKTLENVLQEVELTLLESDVAVEVIEAIQAEVRASLKGKKLRWGEDASQAIEAALRKAVLNVLDMKPFDLEAAIKAGPKPYVIMFLGVNGSGKTTTLAKIASWLVSRGHGVVMAASDTFRAGAVEQLEVHAEKVGVKVIRQKEGADPAAVAFDALHHAKSRHIEVVLVDTAGRQHTNENLVEEAKKIRRVVNPALTLFVGDALSGNDMVEQARLFSHELGFDGVVLTKLDADVKGGAALSVAYVVKKPILFVGVGQGYGDLKPFEPRWMMDRLFGGSTGA